MRPHSVRVGGLRGVSVVTSIIQFSIECSFPFFLGDVPGDDFAGVVSLDGEGVGLRPVVVSAPIEAGVKG